MSGYSIEKAYRIVSKMDNSRDRLTVFSDIARKNRVIKCAYFFYDIAPSFIKSYLLILYGLKCYLSANWRGSPSQDIVFFASCPNEHVAVAHLRSRLTGLKQGDLALARANCFRLPSLLALPEFLYHLPRLHRIARRLVRRFHFLPACRVFSTMTYYLRFRRLLAAGSSKSVFIANHYSPEALALAAAAHRSDRRVFCANHANGSWRSGYVPPLHSDLVAVTSEVILDAYTRHSSKALNTVFVPQPSPQRPMRCRIEAGRPVTVGIFLTALTDMAHLQRLLRQLEASPLVARVLIRAHPVKVVNEDLSAVVEQGARVEESAGLPLFENISRCDIAICGNSSVAIDVLRGGVPVFFDDGLDDLASDINGYLRENLVMVMPGQLDAAALRSLESFYARAEWVDIMRRYDAAYGRDEDVMFEKLRDAVVRQLRAQAAPARRFRRRRPVAGRPPLPVVGPSWRQDPRFGVPAARSGAV